jgi:uncharacterized membrane protein YadS
MPYDNLNVAVKFADGIATAQISPTIATVFVMSSCAGYAANTALLTACGNAIERKKAFG